MPRFEIAVIGAGMTGLNAAHILHRAGHKVQVFEKSRGLGGRLAARRTDYGIFNHGAQYATARHPDFVQYLENAVDSGAAEHWAAQQWPDPTTTPTIAPEPPETWYRGKPAMNKLVSSLNSGFDIQCKTRIAQIAPTNHNRYQLYSFASEQDHKNRISHGEFDGVIVTIPAPQSAELLMPLSPRFDVINDVKMAPCWAVMLAFQESTALPFDVFSKPDPAISWIGRNPLTKAISPPAPYECWTIHASVDWSQTHLEEKAEDVVNQITAVTKTVFAQAGARLPMPVSSQAHRWRYARTTSPLGQSHFASADGRVIAAGDWCMGARIEAAFQSGEAAAHAMIDALQG
ncbi:NAD(P)/FAD-dependent oxidoreductase [Thalassospira sp. TSL5-1]|uniref:NAD(P)/FAD-dependent oxidoreductase n=1 Tax=Thalassospira sp. TSL5-1 TaxID=1544451 RepID=UPI00093FEDA0|nr:FAD-dependent oxidoreductase [Thalassospira sp. TSL5-1]OKH90118.1 hypothetical protein LF95_09625 [Thalassospira sp. TSL5-1]